MGTIKTVKQAMGYEAANERLDNCKHCQHAETLYEDRSPPWDRAYLQCKEGHFRTSNMSVCERHMTKKGSSHG